MLAAKSSDKWERFKVWHLVGLLLGTFAFAAPLRAAVVTSTPNLPVGCPAGIYLTPADVHATYQGPGFTVILKRLAHIPFAQQTQRQIVGTEEVETFPSILTGAADFPAFGVFNLPVQASGPVVTRVFGKAGQTTGAWDTEMLSMSLSGTTPFGPFMIRESPTLPSVGRTTVDDMGGGLYRISSFFDVFTELSVDGGQTWTPSVDGPARVELTPAFTLAPAVQGSGTLSADPNQRCYGSNTVVTLTASANSGWAFSGWTGDASGTNNPLSLTMTNDRTITAHFTRAGLGMDWFTIDGGGGRSTNSQFTVKGTVGQPDAGRTTNGQYSLIGGFFRGTNQSGLFYLGRPEDFPLFAPG